MSPGASASATRLELSLQVPGQFQALDLPRRRPGQILQSSLHRVGEVGEVHPEEVEAIISRHPAVADVAVVGLPDTRWGEVVVAAVIPLDTVTADDLDDFCHRSELADYKRPRKYFLVDELPRNTAMKVSRRKLRELLKEHEAARASSATGLAQFTIEETT